MNRFFHIQQELKKDTARPKPARLTASAASGFSAHGQQPCRCGDSRKPYDKPYRLTSLSRYTRSQTQNEPECEAARWHIDVLRDYVNWLDHELNNPSPHPERLRLKRNLINLKVDEMLMLLPEFIAQGCCEPHLKTMEKQVDALPWHNTDPSEADHQRLKRGIKDAQNKAKKDFEHC